MFYSIITLGNKLVSTDFYDDTLACTQCYRHLRNLNIPFVLYRKDGCNLTNIKFYGDWMDHQLWVNLCDVPQLIREKMCKSILLTQNIASKYGNECTIRIYYKDGLYCLYTDGGEDNFGCKFVNYRFYYGDEQITV